MNLALGLIWMVATVFFGGGRHHLTGTFADSVWWSAYFIGLHAAIAFMTRWVERVPHIVLWIMKRRGYR